MAGSAAGVELAPNENGAAAGLAVSAGLPKVNEVEAVAGAGDEEAG